MIAGLPGMMSAVGGLSTEEKLLTSVDPPLCDGGAAVVAATGWGPPMKMLITTDCGDADCGAAGGTIPCGPGIDPTGTSVSSPASPSRSTFTVAPVVASTVNRYLMRFDMRCSPP